MRVMRVMQNKVLHYTHYLDNTFSLKHKRKARNCACTTNYNVYKLNDDTLSHFYLVTNWFTQVQLG